MNQLINFIKNHKILCIVLSTVFIALIVGVILLVVLLPDEEENLATSDFIQTDGKIIVEAESAVLFGNGSQASEREGCSGGKMLGEMSSTRASYADYKISFEGGGKANMTFKMTYIRAELSMDKVLEVVLNGNKLDLKNVAVYRTCEDYRTYFEFPIAEVDLLAGENEMRITSMGGGFDIDYITFSAPQTYQSDSVILEAEDALVASLAYPTENKSASNDKVLSHATGGKFTLSVNAEKTGMVRGEIRFCYYNSTETIHFNNMMGISVNGKSLVLESGNVSPTSSNAQFRRISIGNLFLRQGENKIVVNSYIGNVHYDCIALYELKNVIVSPDKETVYEAENTATMGGCSVEEQEDGSKAVVFNNPTTCVSFVVEAKESFSTALTLGLSYWGEYDKMDRVLFVTVNGYLVNVSGITMQVSPDVPAKYYDFKDYILGNITLEKGLNTVTITAVEGNYNLNCIVFN